MPSIIPNQLQAWEFPYARSNKYASPWDVLPLPLDPADIGGLASDADTFTFSDIAVADWVKIEGCTIDGQFYPIDPLYPYWEIEDVYARGLTMFKACFCRSIYFPVFNFSTTGDPITAVTAEILLPKGTVLSNILIDGTETSPDTSTP